MKRKHIWLLVICMSFALFFAASVTALGFSARSDAVYAEDFSSATETDFNEIGGFSVTNQALRSTDRYAYVRWPVQNVIPEYWSASMDITYLYETVENVDPVVDSCFVGFNVYDCIPGETIEFTMELGGDGMSYSFIKRGDQHIANTFFEIRNPNIVLGETFRFRIERYGDTLYSSVNNVVFLVCPLSGMGRPSGFNTYAFSQRAVTIDNVVIDHASPKNTETPVYTQTFQDAPSGSVFGDENGFIVTEDKMAGSNALFNTAYLPINAESFLSDWTISYDAVYPENVYNFLGVNVHNLKTGSVFEFTTERQPYGDFAYIKENDVVIAHSNDPTGIQNPVMKTGRPNYIKITKSGSNIGLQINGALIISIDLSGLTTPDAINFYSYNAVGVTFDNIQYTTNIFTAQVQSVVADSDKYTFSTRSSCTFSAQIYPVDMGYTQLSWYLNQTLVDGQNQPVFVFQTQTTGTYTAYCIVDGIESNTVTVTVTPPSAIESESVYYENFDNFREGASYGSFVARNGQIHTLGRGAFGSQLLPVAGLENWELSMDVTFNASSTTETFFGISADGLIQSPRTYEFNLIRSAAGDDKVAIKQNQFFTTFNDTPVYGMLPQIHLENSVVYTLRIIRYQDQLEIWLNDQIAIKYYARKPAALQRLSIFWFNESGADLSADHLRIRVSDPVFPTVNPPHVSVTGSYVSQYQTKVYAGQSVTLTANTEPFDATPDSYAWYMNGTQIAGGNAKHYIFSPQQAGSYTFVCVIDGVMSEAKIVIVHEAPAQTTTIVPAPAAGIAGIGPDDFTGILLPSAAMLLLIAVFALFAVKKHKQKAYLAALAAAKE